jgi:hypothetical protein
LLSKTLVLFEEFLYACGQSCSLFLEDIHLAPDNTKNKSIAVHI